MIKNNNYKKTILMTLLIVPLFITGIAIANFQTVDAGALEIPEPTINPDEVRETIPIGDSILITKIIDPDENSFFDFVGVLRTPAQDDCVDTGFLDNIELNITDESPPTVFLEGIKVNPDAIPGEYHCTIIWVLGYEEEFNDYEEITKTVTQQIWIIVPEPRPDEGCTPGFWKQAQHLGHWAPTGLSTEDTLASQFFVTQATPEASLLEALSLKGGKGIAGAEHILLRTAVAALLNAAHPDVGYPLTPDEVREYVSIALAEYDRETLLELKDMLDESNNTVCPIKGQSFAQPEPTTCDLGPIENAPLQCDAVAEGDKCQFTCNEGFESSIPEVECTDGEIVETPVCTAIPTTCEECSIASSEALIFCEGELNCKISVLQEFAECTLTCEGESNGIPEACFNSLSGGFSKCLGSVLNPDDFETCEQEYVEQQIDCAANIPP